MVWIYWTWCAYMGKSDSIHCMDAQSPELAIHTYKAPILKGRQVKKWSYQWKENHSVFLGTPFHIDNCLLEKKRKKKRLGISSFKPNILRIPRGFCKHPKQWGKQVPWVGREISHAFRKHVASTTKLVNLTGEEWFQGSPRTLLFPASNFLPPSPPPHSQLTAPSSLTSS